ncbi:unnamed protein product [Cochlearia groenlandica]
MIGFEETTSYWAPPSSPSPRTILAMLNQTDNDVNPMNEIFHETNTTTTTTTTRTNQQRSGHGERLADRRIGFNLPRLEITNMNPFASLFRCTTTTTTTTNNNNNNNNVTSSSPVVAISPGFSPSALLQSPLLFSNSSQITSPLIANDVPQEMVESSGHATTTMMMIFNNDSSSSSNDQPLLHVEMPPTQQGSYDIPTEESVYIPSHDNVDPIGASLVGSFESEVIDETDIINFISLDSENEEDEDEYEDEFNVQDNIVDDLDMEPSSPKRRRYEISNMIGATRISKNKRVIIQMESEEDHPDDGFRWRKYGRKVVKGNPNPRSYYKCTQNGCKVKKHVERGADNMKLIVTTYDGIHDHSPPATRGRPNPGSRNRSGSSQDPNNNRTGAGLGRPLSRFISQDNDNNIRPCFSSSLMGPRVDMTELYLTGLSKLPTLPVNHQENLGFVYRNVVEPMVHDDDGTREVYKGITQQLFLKYGVNL